MENQLLTFIGVNVAMFAALASLVVWTVNRHEGEVKGIVSRMDKMDARFESHSARIDQLYKMFVDLLNERNQKKENKNDL